MITVLIIVSVLALICAVLVFPTLSAYDMHLDDGDDQ